MGKVARAKRRKNENTTKRGKNTRKTGKKTAEKWRNLAGCAAPCSPRETLGARHFSSPAQQSAEQAALSRGRKAPMPRNIGGRKKTAVKNQPAEVPTHRK